MIADILKVMAVGALAATFVCAYLQHIGVAGPGLLAIAGAVGAGMAWLMTERASSSTDDGHDYLRRRR